ncbi:sensor histidine kinase [Comamonas koreensis]|uniref:histidine kinase n=1 Tax=Comamonas koreensis TaxID=160825 RepID=A0AAW4XW82_9BURK|nr:HAMP domain-containing sensor histidine kinase [Comamonas koreensis]MCD2165139.1 HAMP domain-containing histidine kinase [Comamonas koreensis]
MHLYKYFAERLYLRIWLTVVGGVAVLILVIGWAWQAAAEKNATPLQPPARELLIRSADGSLLLHGEAVRQPGDPSELVLYLIEDDQGRTYEMELQRRSGRGEGHRPPPPNLGPWWFWVKPPFGFFWMLGLIGVVVVVGVFPIIRRLMGRLEALRKGVKQFGDGDLSVRVDVRGNDEVSDLAEQFNAAAARIEALVQSHKSLLANSSHELRSPLTRIRMGVELMGEKPSPTFKQEIQRNIAELDQLVDEILLASRLGAREADVGTSEMIDIIGLCAEECARVEADLEVADMHGDAIEVRGIAKLLRRAVRNLLENARRYSQGPITLFLDKQGAYAEIRVADRGPGVPPDQRERIFESFYRMPGASERHGGVGLGLALVRSIAERHEGSVHCEGREGGGAVFVLRLPLAPLARSAPAQTLPPASV